MLKIFTVYDNKAKAYITPFFLPTQGMAVREFEYVCNDPTHMFCRFPTDYTLFMIGEFDESSGAIFVSEHHENLGLAASYKRDNQTDSVSPAVASVD